MFLIAYAEITSFVVSKKKNFSHSKNQQSAVKHSQSFRGYHDASLLPSPQVSLTCCLPGRSKEVISHSASLLPSPQFSLSDAPFLGAQGSDQSPCLPVGVGSCLGTGPRALSYPVAIPSELVHPSNEYSWGSVIWSVRTAVRKRNQDTVRFRSSSFISRFLHSSLAEPPVRQLGCPPGCNLAEASRHIVETSTRKTKHHIQRVELRFTTPVGPEELILKALSPKQRDFRVFTKRL